MCHESKIYQSNVYLYITDNNELYLNMLIFWEKHVWLYLNMLIFEKNMYDFLNMLIFWEEHVWLYLNMLIFWEEHACMHVYTYTYIYTHTRKCAHAHTHTHTHTDTYIYTYNVYTCIAVLYFCFISIYPLFSWDFFWCNVTWATAYLKMAAACLVCY